MSWFLSSGGLILTHIKKKCGLQNKYNTEKNTVPYFLHLSIIGIHVHLHSELLHERFKYRFNLDLKF